MAELNITTASTSGNGHKVTGAPDSVLDLMFASFGEVRTLLLNQEITDIYVNDDGHLWVDAAGRGREYTGVIISSADADRVIRLIAARTHTVVNELNPIISAEIPGDGSRFEGIIPPVAVRPIFAIRKCAYKIFSLSDYVANKVMRPKQRACLEKAAATRKNILVAGGTGSGKTTLVNAILDYIGKHTLERIIILEDTRELRCGAPDVLYLRTSDIADMTRLLKSCMRLRPDRIVVGEVRGKEALDMLKAWNTGHPGGVGTIHANTAEQALARVLMCARESGTDVQPELIADAIDIIVHIARDGSGRSVKQILAVRGYDKHTHEYRLETVTETEH